MEKMVAMCGIDCGACPAYVATVNNDDEKRRKTAEEWSAEYKTNLKPEDINCMGCLTKDGPVFGYCTKCEVRKCGMTKGVENCAHCDDYACEKLTKFVEMVPAAKNTLDEIKRSL
jgi:hypothetical protein